MQRTRGFVFVNCILELLHLLLLENYFTPQRYIFSFKLIFLLKYRDINQYIKLLTMLPPSCSTSA